ncbi:MAG: hypothetical protein GKR94_15660 [Gammaproteobacteria bacterium]|nr:hypothetical protein [Gammaproteobacteria bacterium]
MRKSFIPCIAIGLAMLVPVSAADDIVGMRGSGGPQRLVEPTLSLTAGGGGVREARIVEGGFKTFIWNDRMRVEDIMYLDGLRVIKTTRETGPSFMSKKETTVKTIRPQ